MYSILDTHRSSEAIWLKKFKIIDGHSISVLTSKINK